MTYLEVLAKIISDRDRVKQNQKSPQQIKDALRRSKGSNNVQFDTMNSPSNYSSRPQQTSKPKVEKPKIDYAVKDNVVMPKAFKKKKIKKKKIEQFEFFTASGEARVRVTQDADEVHNWAKACGLSKRNLVAPPFLVVDYIQGDQREIIDAIKKFAKKEKYDAIYMVNPPTKTSPWKKLQGNVWQIAV